VQFVLQGKHIVSHGIKFGIEVVNMAKKRISITVGVSEKMRDELNVLAKHREIKAADIVRVALRRELDEGKEAMRNAA